MALRILLRAGDKSVLERHARDIAKDGLKLVE